MQSCFFKYGQLLTRKHKFVYDQVLLDSKVVVADNDRLGYKHIHAS